jgi:N6-adenosine-specific RNA methylase IME4
VTYRVIAADPPWPLRWRPGTIRKDGRGVSRRNLKKRLGYETMSVEAIAALPVRDLAAVDAALFLWVPDEFLLEGDAARVARAWGFEPGRVILWWTKRGYGLGTFPRPQHEAVLVCTRGSIDFAVRNRGSVHEWKQPYENGARKHSAKPEGAYDLIEEATGGLDHGGPFLELFARRGRLGWDHWGDEALQTVELAEAMS